ncbi:MAG TPA: hypothetical protein VK988_12875 [Acidimicrobiales bacterium]|nr:hypothetical protein [Acidimicrobiales bacterium]
MRSYEFEGSICSAAFASGDRFVVGHWHTSPLGPITDVMWARPDGERVLLAPTPEVAAFVGGVYGFDRVQIVDISVDFDGRRLALEAGEVAVTMQGGPGWRLPLARLRPPWFTRWVEAWIARPLLGVRTYGVGRTGVRQWYRAEEYRPVVEATAALGGANLGSLRPLDVPVGFGFSGPPRRPSMVKLRSLLVDPLGRLEGLASRQP